MRPPLERGAMLLLRVSFASVVQNPRNHSCCCRCLIRGGRPSSLSSSSSCSPNTNCSSKLILLRTVAASSSSSKAPPSATTRGTTTACLSTSAAAGPLSLESLEVYASRAAEDQPFSAKKKASSNKPRRPPTASDAKSFASLPLSPLLQQRLQQLDLKVPTDVQAAAIPILQEGEDAAIQSYTGSGKTLAYLLPVLSRIGPLGQLPDKEESLPPSKQTIEAVIVAPSRELAMQIVRETEKILGSEHRKAVQQLVGGANRSRQEEALKKNKPCIVVGTPGRISEISRDGRLHTHACRFLILDEADQLLSVQFREDMRRILEQVGVRRTASSIANRPLTGPGMGASMAETPNGSNIVLDKNFSKPSPARVQRQTVLVSATMPSAVLRAASEWGQKPVLVKGKVVVGVDKLRLESGQEDIQGARESLPPALKHFYAVSQLQHKVDTARKCIHALNAKSVIVFMNHSRRLKDTVFKFEARGIDAASLHGELSKLERANTLAAFKNGKLRVLVTSEVGARGLDVPECDMVVNLELPTDMIHYAHRAGRTGRLGRTGLVVSICEEREAFVLRKFQRQLGVQIEECELAKGGMVLSRDAKSVQATAIGKA